MKRIFIITGKKIANIIDFFYPPFKKYVSIKIFRYGVSGSLILVISWITFPLLYQFVIQKRVVNLYFFSLSGHAATLALNFVISLCVGFFLQKYVTFTASDLRGRKQLIRYTEVGLLNLFLNYIGLKFMVEFLHVFPSVSNAIVSLVVTVVSYLLQTTYTFPTKKDV